MRALAANGTDHKGVELFAALDQQLVQRTGHCGQDKIIHSAAVAVGKLANLVQVRDDRMQAPVWPSGLV